MKWEYKVVDYSGSSLSGKQEYLNKQGSEGWELISTRGDMLFFKRPLPDDSHRKALPIPVPPPLRAR